MFYYSGCRVIIEEIFGIRHDINVVEHESDVLVRVGVHLFHRDEPDVLHGTTVELAFVLLVDVEHSVGIGVDIFKNRFHVVGEELVLFLAVAVRDDEY